MRENDQLLWALDNSISPSEFERLCVDLLGREGYRHIKPIGGTKDHGRDAELGYTGQSDGHQLIAFQFTLEKRWELKLWKDAGKIAKHRHEVGMLVFVTSRNVTGETQDSLQHAIRERYGWELRIYAREWLRARLAELHQDLAAKYLGVVLPPTPGYAATQFEFTALDDEKENEIFRHTSPELLRATLAARTEREPNQPVHWYQLARIEYMLRNYDAAIRAVTRAVQLEPADELLVLNMRLFQAALLAEKGIAERSRPLLIRARDIMLQTLPGHKRGIDHYNLGNILGALGETAQAKKQYARALVLERTNAKAWKNLGSLFAREGDHESALEAFDKALECQPALVEAHLCKATAYLIFRNDPEEAITCFETALRIATSVHEKWPYVGYWYSQALAVVGRDEEALRELDFELAVRPDDVFLLSQKLLILRQLRKHNARYEEAALQFAQFRAEALPVDYAALGEIVEILQARGESQSAWPFIDENLHCEPYRVSQLAADAELDLEAFASGFAYAPLYQQFRSKFSIEDYCVMLHGYGLSPDASLIVPLTFMSLPVFGLAARALDPANGTVDAEKLNGISGDAVARIARVFPLAGAKWLASREPEDSAEKQRLLTLGMCYLTDVVAAEAARLIGFLRGCYRISEERTFPIAQPNWPEIGSQVAMNLLLHVGKEWKMLPGDDRKDAM